MIIPSVALALVLSGAHEQAPEQPSLKAPMIAYALGASADLISTARMLDRGMVERNPISNALVGQSKPKILALGITADVATLFVAHKLSKKHPKLARTALYIGAIARFALAVHNEQLKKRVPHSLPMNGNTVSMRRFR